MKKMSGNSKIAADVFQICPAWIRTISSFSLFTVIRAYMDPDWKTAWIWYLFSLAFAGNARECEKMQKLFSYPYKTCFS